MRKICHRWCRLYRLLPWSAVISLKIPGMKSVRRISRPMPATFESPAPRPGANATRFSQTDITDAAAVAAQFSEFRPDIVMHLAAEKPCGPFHWMAQAAFIQTNVIGTFTLRGGGLSLLVRAWEAQKQAFRFHHISHRDEVMATPHGNRMTCSPKKCRAP